MRRLFVAMTLAVACGPSDSRYLVDDVDGDESRISDAGVGGAEQAGMSGGLGGAGGAGGVGAGGATGGSPATGDGTAFGGSGGAPAAGRGGSASGGTGGAANGGAGGMPAAGGAAAGGSGGAAAGGSGGVAAGPNLVKNPGFEGGTTGWSTPNGKGGAVSPGRSGQYCLRESEPHGWWQQDLGPFSPGKTYEISAWGKSPAGGCRFGVKGGLASGGEYRQESATFGTSWAQRSFMYTLPGNATWLQFFFTGNGSTGCEYDDVVVRER